MSLHQITVIGLSEIFEKQMLKSYTKIASNIINPKNSNQIIKFINYLNKNNKFKTFYKKIYNIYLEWFKKTSKFLRYINQKWGLIYIIHLILTIRVQKKTKIFGFIKFLSFSSVSLNCFYKQAVKSFSVVQPIIILIKSGSINIIDKFYNLIGILWIYNI